MEFGPWQIVGIALVLLGLIGAVVPILPGALLIWVGAFIWSWADGFRHLGWFSLLVLGLLAILAMASDLIVTSMTGRKAGMSWRTLGAALVGGILGGLLLSLLPILGTISGAILGAVIGILLSEYHQQRNWTLAWKAVGVYLTSYLLSRVFELVISLVMIGIFFFQTFPWKW